MASAFACSAPIHHSAVVELCGSMSGTSEAIAAISPGVVGGAASGWGARPTPRPPRESRRAADCSSARSLSSLRRSGSGEAAMIRSHWAGERSPISAVRLRTLRVRWPVAASMTASGRSLRYRKSASPTSRSWKSSSTGAARLKPIPESHERPTRRSTPVVGVSLAQAGLCMVGCFSVIGRRLGPVRDPSRPLPADTWSRRCACRNLLPDRCGRTGAT